MVEMMMEEKAGFHVEFEQRPVEDREQSIKQGIVTDELLYEWRHGDNKRKPPSPHAFRAYEAWKEGLEAPVEGTDLRNWPGVTPAQLKTCQGIHVRSLEDLAEANADTIRKMGMGGVSLVKKAKSYLKSAGNNKASEEIGSMQVKLDSLVETIAKKDAQIDELMEELDGSKRKRKVA